jgi:hypothetical protein
MKKERLQYLVDEYRAAEKKLKDIREERVRMKISLEIFQDLEKEFKKEIKRAQDDNDSSRAKHWEDILNTCFVGDKDRPKEETIEKINTKVSEQEEKLIVYYERKIKMIERLLGSREVELIENYDHKSILMGGQHSSARLSDEIEEEEDKREEEKKRKGFTFDKM